MFNSHLKTYNLEFTVKSLLFIGGGELSSLNKTQYIFNQKEKMVYVIDERKFSAFLRKEGTLDDYMKSILDNSKNFNISRYLRNTRDISICSKAKIPAPYTEFDNKDNKKNLNDINCFIKNSNYLPYIPGSSIKGAIRTAILCKKIISNKQEYSSYWYDDGLKDALIGANKYKIKKITQKIENRAFRKGSTEATNDIFRGISISDTTPFKKEDLFIAQKQDYTLNKNKINQISTYREYLRPDAKANFTLNIDTSIVEDKDLCSFDSIKKSLELFLDFYQKLLLYSFKEASQYYNNILLPSCVNLMLGGGAGFLTKTITYALAPDKNDAVYAVKRYLSRAFNKHKHDILDKQISPRTLKLSKYKNNYYDVGRAEIKEIRKQKACSHH